jgi:hypothetical protein
VVHELSHVAVALLANGKINRFYIGFLSGGVNISIDNREVNQLVILAGPVLTILATHVMISFTNNSVIKIMHLISGGMVNTIYMFLAVPGFDTYYYMYYGGDILVPIIIASVSLIMIIFLIWREVKKLGERSYELRNYEPSDFCDRRQFRTELCEVCGHHLPIDQSIPVGVNWKHSDVRICVALVKKDITSLYE